MKVQCSCGQVKGEIENFLTSTPGRLVCYCDDCQDFLKQIERTDLLDECGGTEIIPIYPKSFKITEGKDKLEVLRLTPEGLFRWYTSCCKTPFGNTRPGFPWLGLLSTVYQSDDLQKVGPVKSRICGKFATSTPPQGTSEKMKFKDIFVVAPFLIKGFLFKKSFPSVYFNEDKTPITSPTIIRNFEKKTSH